MGTQPLNPEFAEKILRQVSRSFALTIPQLPRALRGPVTNAYLLCRIADTIEDDEALSLDQKRFFFEQFVKVLKNEASARQFADSLGPLLSANLPAGEKELIENTPGVLETTWGLSPEQISSLRRCAEIMAQGMMRFQEIKNRQGLKDVAEYHRYCYHVAGVVGEMLTELFCQYSDEIGLKKKELLARAVSFGQGLQMTNIMKDLWEDWKRGACWLPRDVFQTAGFDLSHLAPGDYRPAFGEGLARLIGIARGHLQSALTYTLMIPAHEAGIRKFCLWAVGMAILTLRKINRKREYHSGDEVKISRSTLKVIILATRMTLRNNFLLRFLFFLATRGLPAPQIRDLYSGGIDAAGWVAGRR